MPISMHFDSFNPKRVPTLQLKAIWLLKGCPAPAFIHSPLPRPLTPISIVTLGMLDICLFRCISSLSTLNVCQHYNSKQYGCLKGARPRLHSKPPLPRPLTPISIVTLGMLDICLFRCISTLSTQNVCQHYNSKQYGCKKGARHPHAFSAPCHAPLLLSA